MKKSILNIVYILITVVLFTSCNGGQSLQEYYIEKQNNDNFISFDIPASIFSLKDDVSNESKETLNSLKKLNVLAFKINNTNKTDYSVENEKIKNILKNKKFNELMRGKNKGIHFVIKYLGTDEAIDEVILFASDKTKGFVVARVLGDHMNPEKIMKVIKDMKSLDKDNAAFSQLGNLLEGFN